MVRSSTPQQSSSGLALAFCRGAGCGGGGGGVPTAGPGVCAKTPEGGSLTLPYPVPYVLAGGAAPSCAAAPNATDKENSSPAWATAELEGPSTIRCAVRAAAERSGQHLHDAHFN